MEVEPRIAKQYKCHHCCSCKKLPGKGDGGWKKRVFASFLADQKIASSWKKCVLGHPIARATSYCLLPDTFWLRASKNAFKVGCVKFANSLSPEVKAAKGLKRCRTKVKVVNNPALTAHIHRLYPNHPNSSVPDQVHITNTWPAFHFMFNEDYAWTAKKPMNYLELENWICIKPRRSLSLKVLERVTLLLWQCCLLHVQCAYHIIVIVFLDALRQKINE